MLSSKVGIRQRQNKPLLVQTTFSEILYYSCIFRGPYIENYALPPHCPITILIKLSNTPDQNGIKEGLPNLNIAYGDYKAILENLLSSQPVVEDNIHPNERQPSG